MPEKDVVTLRTVSAAETRNLASRLAGRLAGGETLLLIGDLGSGKTTFVQGLAIGLAIKDTVKSPTYLYLREYTGTPHRLAHYDLYRLPDNPSEQDLLSIELPDRLADSQVVTVIEWADRLAVPPEEHHRIEFAVEGDERRITVPTSLGQERT